ncbi:MAG: carboxymuconolactone decarboxylase family protein, partial [Burkholderiaceae bacterium]|nr:carboxymuconolactone decarboxylase family protein [Burkholderiaceae bacterium]
SVLAHSLEGTRALLSLGQYMRNGSRLDARLRELAVIQVAFVTRSAYAFYHHVETGFKAGVTESDVDALLAEARGERSALGEIERALLGMARQLTADIRVDAATFRFLEQSLGRELLVDLALVIGYYNNVVRMVACFEVGLEPGYEELARRFPMPAAGR